MNKTPRMVIDSLVKRASVVAIDNAPLLQSIPATSRSPVVVMGTAKWMVHLPDGRRYVVMVPAIHDRALERAAVVEAAAVAA